jgi:hypothetical protein
MYSARNVHFWSPKKICVAAATLVLFDLLNLSGLTIAARGGDILPGESCPIINVPDKGVAKMNGRTLSGSGFLVIVKEHLPVIVKNAASDWRAMRDWTDEYLQNKAGDVEIQVESSDDKYFDWRADSAPSRMLISEYFRRRESENLYWAQAELPVALQPDIIEPHWAVWQDPWLGPLIWHGPGGQVTPAHSDVYDNLICMVKGRKQFVMYAPWEFHLVQPDIRESTYLELDIERPDLERFPGFAHATRYTGTIESGDCLFLPALWTHQVYTGGCTNIGVNMWYRPIVARPVQLLHNLVHAHLFQNAHDPAGFGSFGGSASAEGFGDILAAFKRENNPETQAALEVFVAADLDGNDGISFSELRILCAYQNTSRPAAPRVVGESTEEAVLRMWTSGLAALGVDITLDLETVAAQLATLPQANSSNPEWEPQLDAEVFTALHFVGSTTMRQYRPLVWRPRRVSSWTFGSLKAIVKDPAARLGIIFPGCKYVGQDVRNSCANYLRQSYTGILEGFESNAFGWYSSVDNIDPYDWFGNGTLLESETDHAVECADSNDTLPATRCYDDDAAVALAQRCATPSMCMPLRDLSGITDCASLIQVLTGPVYQRRCDEDLSSFGITFPSGSTMASVCPHACGTC